MDPERLARAEAIFHEIVDLQPREQAHILDQRCGDDAELRGLLDGMLARSLDHLPPLKLGSAELPSGSVISGYRIVRLLGEGGMGQVYLAESGAEGRRVAIKLLRPEVGRSALGRRFRSEIAILKRLQHPGIVGVEDAGATDDGRSYLVMEYVPGLPLTEYVRIHDLSPEARLDLLARIADAVHHAHEAGVLHRDLKPSNILIVDDGEGARPRIVDFGIARPLDVAADETADFTRTGQLVGTLAYMSPEQILGRSSDLDVRSDVYQLGVLCYELLGGKRPHQVDGLSFGEALDLITRGVPWPLGDLVDGGSRGLTTIVATAMAPDRRDRYGSAAALAEDIRRYLAGEGLAARTNLTRRWLRGRLRSRRLIAPAIALAVLVGALGVRLSSDGPKHAVRHAPRQTRITAQLDEIEGAHFLALSPEGDQLAYTDQVGDIRLRSIAEQRDTVLVAATDTRMAAGLSWHPSGDWLLVEAWGHADGVRLLRLDLASMDESVLFTGSYKPRPVISPDGDRALIIRDYAQELAILDLTTGSVTTAVRLPDGETLGSPTWGPRGERIAYHRTGAPDEMVECLRLDDGRRDIVVGGDDLCNYTFHSNLCWLPDGRLLFVRYRDRSQTGVDLWAAAMHPIDPRPRGEPLRMHTFTAGHMTDLTVSRDGTRLVFEGRRRQLSLALIDPADPEPRDIATRGWPCYPVGWTDGGASLVIREINDQDVVSTLVADTTGLGARPLAGVPGGIFPVGLIEDGREVVVAAAEGIQGISIPDGRRRDLRFALERPDLWAHVRSSRVEDFLVTVQGEQLVVRRLDDIGDASDAILRRPLDIGPYSLNNIAVDVSPDGRRLALGELKHAVTVVSLDDGQGVEVELSLGRVQGLCWADDGWIYCTGMHGPGATFWLGRIRPDGSQQETIWSSDRTWVGRPLSAPGGGLVAVQFMEMGADFYMLEGF